MNQKNISSSDLDIGKFIRILFMNSKLIILIVLIFTSISVSYYLLVEKTYRVSSLIKVDSSSLSDSDIPLDLLNGSTQVSSLEDMVVLYDSRSTIKKLIEQFNLNLEGDNNFQLFSEKIKLLNIYDLNYENAANVELVLFKENFDFISDELGIFEKKIPYNTLFQSDKFEIEVTNPSVNSNQSYTFVYFSPDYLIKKYQSLINIRIENNQRSFSVKRSGLLSIDLNLTDLSLGRKIINFLNDEFINNDLNNQKEKARRAVAFIDERLSSLDDILRADKLEFSRFQEVNKSVDVDIEVQNILKNLSEIQSMINELELEKSRVESIYTSSNPLYQNLLQQEKVLKRQKLEIESRIQQLPNAKQSYINLYRNVEISEEVYKELMERKIGFSILEASTIGNIKVIDDAYLNFVVSPRLSIIPYTFFLSFFGAIGFALFRGIYFNKISNPAEINDQGINIPISGVFNSIDENEIEDDNRYDVALESFIVNINSLLEINTNRQTDKGNVIAITSPTSGNGKTTTIVNLAKKLASMKKKTLVIDCDFKRGDVHKFFNIKRFEGDSFLQFDIEDLNSIKERENLYIIGKPSKLNDSFTYVNSIAFSDQIKALSKRFDYVLIDTGPVLAVSDTLLLSSLSDLMFLLLRHDMNYIAELKQSVRSLDQIGKTYDGIIYNAYKKPSGYYGYYKYYGDYNYQYYAEKYLYNNYEYNED